MITLIIATSELEKIKSLLPEEVKIVQQTEAGSLTALNVKLEGIPFDLSTQETMRSLKMILCGKGGYEETDVTDRSKVCVIAAFKEDGEMIYLAKK
jgi:hypothetical protein